MGLACAISTVNIFFENFYYANMFCFSLLICKYSCSIQCINNVQTSEILNTWNLLKICNAVTYPIEFGIICSHFDYGKMKILDFLKSVDIEYKILMHK